MNPFPRSTLSLLFGVLVALQGCIPDYALEFRARLVDSDTGRAIEGAIVVAHWQIRGGLEGGNPVGEAMIMEAVTDKSGSIRFPSWSRTSWKIGGIQNSRPELIIFKSHYHVRRLSNESRPTLIDDLVLRSDWNEKTIAIEKFKGSQEEYAKEIAWLDSSMYFARRGGHCEWKSTPRMLVALHKADIEFQSIGVTYPPGTINRVTDVNDAGGCGSASQFFSSYLPSGVTK